MSSALFLVAAPSQRCFLGSESTEQLVLPSPVRILNSCRQKGGREPETRSRSTVGRRSGSILTSAHKRVPNAVGPNIGPLLKRARGSLGVASTALYVRPDERKIEMQFALMRTLKFVAGVTLTAIFSARSIQ